MRAPTKEQWAWLNREAKPKSLAAGESAEGTFVGWRPLGQRGSAAPVLDDGGERFLLPGHKGLRDGLAEIPFGTRVKVASKGSEEYVSPWGKTGTRYVYEVKRAPAKKGAK